MTAPRKRRFNVRQLFINMALSFRHGLERPSTDLSAKINVGVWSIMLLSSVSAVTIDVLTQDWGFAMWWNGVWALVQGTMLRWSLHGRVYRQEVQAKEAEEQQFLEVLKGGYGVHDGK